MSHSCTRLIVVCLVLMPGLSLLLIFSETDGSGHEDGGDGKEKPPKGRRNTDDEKKDAEAEWRNVEYVDDVGDQYEVKEINNFNDRCHDWLRQS